MKRTVLAYLAIGALLSAPCAFAQRAGHDANLVARFQAALKQDGFSIQPGVASDTDWAGLYCNGDRADAGYVNKAPYLLIQVPRSADDPSPVENFKLRPDEAIVLIGPTPPPTKYFGYYAFLATRISPSDPDGKRNPLVATLGDAINNATIKTIGPAPFNTLVSPASMLNLGESSTADEVTFKVRIGMSEGDPEALTAYVRSARTTLTVLRVTPLTTAIANPFPVPPLRVRGTGQTEIDLMKKVDQLREAIIAAQPGLHAVDIQSKPVGYDGYDYIQQGINPGADSRDNLFLAAGYIPEFGLTGRITLADDEFLVVYGVNHVATGKASYASVNVYASEFAKLSIGQVVHNQFANTAAPYLPHGDPAASKLYAYKASRNCGDEPNCLPLRVDSCPRLNIDDKTVLGFFFRMYLEPATRAGAAMQEIVYDRVIKFSPRP